MANEEHLAILKQGVGNWNKWRKEYPEVKPDLSRTDLSHTDLSRANLSLVDLRSADLRSADLHEVDLSEASLSQADLSFAHLRFANFRGADLSHADLSHTDLSRTDLRFADLSHANLSFAVLSQVVLIDVDISEANIGWTVFSDTDLSKIKRLDSVKHRGPSYIDIHAIYKSNGNIPEAFLRGAGIPNNFITYMKSLTGAAFDFYSCFISYSSKDQEFVEQLYADLQAKGVRCWYAPHDIQGGKKLHEQIDQAIRLYDKLLLVLSTHSMVSEWVKTEIYKARKREAEEQRRKLFPISLVEYEQVRQWEAFDGDTGKDMARDVREYYVPNFTHWKDHDAYQQAFERLLHDLKAQT